MFGKGNNHEFTTIGFIPSKSSWNIQKSNNEIPSVISKSYLVSIRVHDQIRKEYNDVRMTDDFDFQDEYFCFR